MWKTMKLHPWRLEIVPAAAFGTVIWSIISAQPSVTAHLGDAGVRELAQFRIWVLGTALLWWLLEMAGNSQWVRSERSKRFNGYALMMQAVLICQAWLAYGTAQCFNWSLQPFDRPWILRGDLLLAAVVSGVSISAVLEWTRRYVPRDEEPEPIAPPVTEGRIGYRETEIDWWFLPGSVIVPIVAVAAYLNGASLGDSAWGIVAGLVFLSLSMRVITVDQEALTVWIGPMPLRFRVPEIESCRPAHHETFKKTRGQRLRAISITSGRCVELTMKNGSVYRIGSLRPKHICELLDEYRYNTTALD